MGILSPATFGYEWEILVLKSDLSLGKVYLGGKREGCCRYFMGYDRYCRFALHWMQKLKSYRGYVAKKRDTGRFLSVYKQFSERCFCPYTGDG